MNQTANTSPKPSEQEKVTKKRRKTKVAETSKEAWRIINSVGQPQIEKAQVLAILPEIQPTTSRNIATTLKIERTNITRSLKDLENDKKIKVAFTAPCKVTGKRVNHYALIDWSKSEGQGGNV